VCHRRNYNGVTLKQIPNAPCTDFFILDRYVITASRYLFSLPFGKFCTFIYIFIFLQNGIWSVPNVEIVRSMSQNVTINVLPPDLQYLYTSFLGLALGWLTGASKSHNAFLGIHLLFLSFGYFILAFQIRNKFGDNIARMVIMAFASIPLCNVLTTWLGTSDVYVYIFGTALAIASQPILILIFSFLLGISHFEQSCFIVLLLVIWRITLSDTLRNTKKIQQSFV